MVAPIKDPKASSESPIVPLLTPEKSLPGKVARGSYAAQIVEEQRTWLGTQLVIHLQILFKTLRLHDRTNAAVTLVVDNVLMLLESLTQEQPAVLRLRGGFLFLGDLHLKASRQHFPVLVEFIESLQAWGIGAISLTPPLRVGDLREFAELFVAFDPATSTVADLRRQLEERGVEGIDLEAALSRVIRSGGNRDRARELAKSCYAQAAEAVGQTLEGVRDARAPYFRRAKRVVQALVDLMLEDQAIVLGLTTLRCHDRYTHNHSVNVGLLSIALGSRAGLSRATLVDLGLAGLFHDVGKTVIPLEILNKPGEFTDEEWDIIRTHPTEGVMSLARLRGVAACPRRMAAASFEHHMQYDGAGYPRLAVPWKQSLTSRIVTIADYYDAVTSSRVYRRDPVAPPKALQLMFTQSGRLFDPVLLKLFVSSVGVLPIGSLALLDTNELAVVTRPPQRPEDAARPWVKVITDPQGSPIDGPEVNLTEAGPGGRYGRSLVRVMDNTEYRFDTSCYFV